LNERNINIECPKGFEMDKGEAIHINPQSYRPGNEKTVKHGVKPCHNHYRFYAEL